MAELFVVGPVVSVTCPFRQEGREGLPGELQFWWGFSLKLGLPVVVRWSVTFPPLLTGLGEVLSARRAAPDANPRGCLRGACSSRPRRT